MFVNYSKIPQGALKNHQIQISREVHMIENKEKLCSTYQNLKQRRILGIYPSLHYLLVSIVY